jgi:hypothetical protein
MATKPTMMFAAGVFLVTTVLFAAAIVVSHALSIPEPAGRFLPSSARDLPDPSASERPDDLAVANDALTDRPWPGDEPVATVTAVPEPRSVVSAAGASDTGAGTPTHGPSAAVSGAAPAAPSSAREPSTGVRERRSTSAPAPSASPSPRAGPPQSEPPPTDPPIVTPPVSEPPASELPASEEPVPGLAAPSPSPSPSESTSPQPSEAALFGR